MAQRVPADELDSSNILDTDILYLLGEALLKMRQLNSLKRKPFEVIYYAIVLMMDASVGYEETRSNLETTSGHRHQQTE